MSLEKAFKLQAEICSKTSLLYSALVTILGSEDEVINLVTEILTKKQNTGEVEIILSLLAYFHYQVLAKPEQYKHLRQFFSTFQGKYQQRDYPKLQQNQAIL